MEGTAHQYKCWENLPTFLSWQPSEGLASGWSEDSSPGNWPLLVGKKVKAWRLLQLTANPSLRQCGPCCRHLPCKIIPDLSLAQHRFRFKQLSIFSPGLTSNHSFQLASISWMQDFTSYVRVYLLNKQNIPDVNTLTISLPTPLLVLIFFLLVLLIDTSAIETTDRIIWFNATDGY